MGNNVREISGIVWGGSGEILSKTPEGSAQKIARFGGNTKICGGGQVVVAIWRGDGYNDKQEKSFPEEKPS